jgi:2-hydroxy-6-oxo-6-(2'-carboxyphenyl)-hexa-2,4-dienoate hydrolase
MAAPVDAAIAKGIKFVDVAGIRTRYYESGEGEPLVLVSGGQFGPTYALDCWSLNVDSLARSFHVYAIDKLGQGHTDNPPRDEDYTFDAVLAHLTGFFRALGITNAHVAGHSRGALLVARLAIESPELVRTLVLLDSSTLSPEDPRFDNGALYTEAARRTSPGPPTLASVVIEPELQAYDPSHITDDYARRLLAIAELPKTQAAQAAMARVGTSIWMPSMERIKAETLQMIAAGRLQVPTVLFWGMNDKSAPLPLGEELYRRLAATNHDAEFHVVNHGGHYAFREQAAAFNRLVKAFCLDRG